ncbi:MAG: CotH kinase family protein [Mucilaginibacter sp.]
MKKPLIYLLLFLAIAGCKKDSHKPAPPVETPEIQFVLYAVSNPGTITGGPVTLTLAGDSAIGVVPAISNQKKFVLSFLPENANVKVGDAVQQSGVTVNDFTTPITYTFTNSKGVVKNYKVSIRNFAGIPILYLNTSGPVVSEDDYITGSISFNANGEYGQDTVTRTLQIKGHGNSTWAMPKKPYKVKFDKKTTVLGMPAAKNWILLANYADKTLLRNSVALSMGQQFSAASTPRYRFVDVVMNGVYQGNYDITEFVEINANRINIPALGAADNSADVITGGYLLEVDQRKGETTTFQTTKGLDFGLKDPDPITPDQLAYIQGYIQQTEDAIFAPNFADPIDGYAKYIDVDSFIDYYLVKELMKDNDGLDYSSIYYYKDRGGKLVMGPLWDFDLAGGNTNYSDCQYPTGWWIRNCVWFNRLFQDPAFAAKVKQRWATLKTTTIPAIFTNIDRNAAYINLSQQQNFKTWNILGEYVWPNVVWLGSYQPEVDYLKTWLNTRVAWMDSNL